MKLFGLLNRDEVVYERWLPLSARKVHRSASSHLVLRISSGHGHPKIRRLRI